MVRRGAAKPENLRIDVRRNNCTASVLFKMQVAWLLWTGFQFLLL